MADPNSVRTQPGTAGHTNLHIWLQRQCGACGDNVSKDDRFVALRGNDDSTGYGGQVVTLVMFVEHGTSTLTDQHVELCDASDCTDCRGAPEYVALHRDCFHICQYEWRAQDADKNVVSSDEVAASNNEMLHRLWRVGAGRQPWRRANVVRLAPEDIQPADAAWHAAFARIATAAGLQQLLHTLPPELLYPVHERSTGALFWRAITVLRLCRKVFQWPSPPRPSPVAHYLPLVIVQSWKRGEALDLVDGLNPAEASSTSAATAPPYSRPPHSRPPLHVPSEIAYMRMVIDRHGICQIQRMSKRPVFDCPSSMAEATKELGFASHGQRVYLIEHADALSSVDLEYFPHDGNSGADGADGADGIVTGRLRLRLPEFCDGFPLWDTPVPPPPANCTLVYVNGLQEMRFEAPHPRLLPWLNSQLNSQLHTVKLHGDYRRGGCAGLTFFFGSYTIIRIYVHRHPGDGALDIFQRQSVQMYGDPDWVYLPIGLEDRIVHMAVQYTYDGCTEGTTVLVKMKLAGDITVGHAAHIPFQRQCILPLGPGGDMTLIYGEPVEAGCMTTVLGTYSGLPPSTPGLHPPSPPSTPPPSLPPFHPSPPGETMATTATQVTPRSRRTSLSGVPGAGNIHYFLSREYLLAVVDKHAPAIKAADSANIDKYLAWAPLASVRTVRLFRKPGTHRLKGMVLSYANGGQRAIGECRLQVGREESGDETIVHHPTRICFRPVCPPGTYHLQPPPAHDEIIEVGVEKDGEHFHEEEPENRESEGEENENDESFDNTTGGNTDYADHHVLQPSKWTCCVLRDGGALSCVFNATHVFLFHFPYEEAKDGQDGS